MPSLRPLHRLGYATALAAVVGLFGPLTRGAHATSVTVYSGQHEQMVEMIADAFTKQTGIDVRIRSGEPPELASQLIKEGSLSPADVYFTGNSPELMLLGEHGLLDRVDPATLARVPPTYSAPDGTWVGVLARENVLAFNPSMMADGALPASLLDLARPAWKGRVAIAPTDADFLPLVGAVAASQGRQAALDWLRGLQRNAQVFDDNEAVMAAVDRGAVATGIVNNYYWARLGAERGFEALHSRLHHFAGGDIGGLVNVSGAAVLASAHDKRAAQQFVAFLVSRPVQEMLARSDVAFEYPLVEGVPAHERLRPFATLQPPPVAPSAIGDDRDAAKLLREAGLI